jgi:hypothetical protein
VLWLVDAIDLAAGCISRRRRNCRATGSDGTLSTQRRDDAVLTP